MARFLTLTATTASVTSGGGTLGVDIAVTGGASLLRIVKIKVAFSAGTGNSTFEIFTKDTKLAGDRIYIAEDFPVTLHDPADTSSGTAAETQEGASVVDYEDEDASGEIHVKFTNDDSVAKTYTYTLIVEEAPAFDSSRVATMQDVELLGGRAYFGGRTSAHTMLEWVSNTLGVRLADDSNYGNLILSVLYLGGFTAADASLRSSGTELQSKLGDGSAFGPFRAANLYSEQDIFLTGASYGALQASNGDLYLRAKDATKNVIVDTGGSLQASGLNIGAGVLTNMAAFTSFGKFFYVGGDADQYGYVVDAAGTALESPTFIGRKSGGTQASRSNVANGDQVNGLIANGWSGATGYWAMGGLLHEVDGVVTDNQRPGSRFSFQCGLPNAVPATKLRIDGDGTILCVDGKLNLAGKTATEVMWKRSGNTIHARLGDDSDYATVEGLFTATNGASGTFTTSVDAAAGIVVGGS